MLGIGNRLAQNRNASLASVDPDAKTYVSSLQTAGYTALSSEVNALSTFFKSVKTLNLWTDMRAMWPYIGGSAAPHAINARNPGTYNLTFNGTFTHDNKGAKSDGLTGYAQTGINLAQMGSNDYGLFSSRVKFDCCFGIYNQNGYKTNMGGQRNNNGPTVEGFFLHSTAWESPTRIMAGLGGNEGDAAIFSYTTENPPPLSDRQGFWAVNGFESGTSVKIYKNGSSVATATPTKVDVTENNNPASIEMYLFAYNRQYAGATWPRNDGYDACQASFHFVFGNVMTPAQQAGFYSAVQALQVALGRGL